MKKLFLFGSFMLLTSVTLKAQTNKIETTGNVGIGTTSPTQPLVVIGNAQISGQLRADLNTTGNSLVLTGTGSNLQVSHNGSSNVQLFNSGGGAFQFNNYSNSSTLFHINGNGYVGIGTTSPTGNLDVRGASFVGTSDFSLGSAGSMLQIDQGASSGNTYSRIRAFSNGGMAVNNLVLQSSGGSVGVGTDNPASLFQVDDGCTKASIGDASGGGLNYGTSYLGFNASRSGSSWLTNGDGGNNGGGVMYSSIFGDMYFSIIPSTGGSGQTLADATVKSNIAMRIDHNDGAVYAKKVYVQLTGWPDYVFKKDYKLMPLAQVKSYIDQNQHLPGLPTDKEVESKGLDVGEMNKLLTKKVEELTLYLIEKDKELNQQHDELRQLKEQVNYLIKASNKH